MPTRFIVKEAKTIEAKVINQQEYQPDSTCKIDFITDDNILSYKNYDAVAVKVTMGKYNPTKKFLTEVADTLAADMTEYLKNGGKANKITARLVYE